MLTRLLSKHKIEEEDEIETAPMPVERPVKPLPWDQLMGQFMGGVRSVEMAMRMTDGETWQKWIDSQVFPNLIGILARSKAAGMWTENPFIAIHRLFRMIELTPCDGQQFWMEVVWDWITQYEIYKLKPKPTVDDLARTRRELGQITSLTQMSKPWPSWRGLSSHLKEAINETQYALDEARTRDQHWISGWE
jgi:hypothetical protein